MSHITILGTGAMGSRMAVQLLKAGHEVTVWNRSLDKVQPLLTAGAKLAVTPSLAVATAECVISMVRDDIASRQVWLDRETGALAHLPKQAIAIESSTVTIGWAQELNQACIAQGASFIDAPVAGSRKQAETAQLIFFAGGNVESVLRAEPILKVMGCAVHYMGPAGSGAAIKLAVNALFGAQIAVLSELIGFLQSCQMDVAKAIEVMSSTPVSSPAIKMAAAAMLSGNFAPQFPNELMEKDLGYLIDIAQFNDANMPLSRASRQVFFQAVEQGYGADNITGLVQLYQN